MTNFKPAILKVMCGIMILFFVCLSGQALADPPKDLVLKYDAAGQKLTVTITHPSFFTGMHHIKLITIRKNNEVIGSHEYKSQPDGSSFAYSYPAAARENDRIDVTALCSIHGSKTASIKIEATGN